MTLPPPRPRPRRHSPAERPARRRPRWLVPLVVVLALVLVAAVALVASLVLGPDRQRRANIAAVSTAFDECDLGGSGATVDRENGSVSFGAVGSSFGPSWGHVECLTDALGMPEDTSRSCRSPGRASTRRSTGGTPTWCCGCGADRDPRLRLPRLVGAGVRALT